MDPTMYGAALLKTLDEAGVDMMTLTEGLLDEELLASRLTRAEVARLLHSWMDAASGLPESLRTGMPEIDWAGIHAVGCALSGPPGQARDEALVFASKALVPATLMWLRVYQIQHPEWFHMTLV